MKNYLVVKVVNHDQGFEKEFSSFGKAHKWLKNNGYVYTGTESVFCKGENKVENMVSCYAESYIKKL